MFFRNPEESALPAIEHSPAPHARIRDVLVAVLLIIGTAVGLLLAHSAESGHSAPSAAATTVVETNAEAVMHSNVAGAPTEADPAGPAVPFGDSFALCLSIGIGCVMALLLVFLATRRPPILGPHAPPQTSVRTFTARLVRVPPITLNALCISRV